MKDIVYILHYNNMRIISNQYGLINHIKKKLDMLKKTLVNIVLERKKTIKILLNGKKVMIIMVMVMNHTITNVILAMIVMC